MLPGEILQKPRVVTVGTLGANSEHPECWEHDGSIPKKPTYFFHTQPAENLGAGQRQDANEQGSGFLARCSPPSPPARDVYFLLPCFQSAFERRLHRYVLTALLAMTPARKGKVMGKSH